MGEPVVQRICSHASTVAVPLGWRQTIRGLRQRGWAQSNDHCALRTHCSRVGHEHRADSALANTRPAVGYQAANHPGVTYKRELMCIDAEVTSLIGKLCGNGKQRDAKRYLHGGRR